MSPVINAAVITNSFTDGKSGMAGWRWLFIIDFLVTIPIALYVFILFPDTPETTKAFYLTKEEKQLAVTRLSDHATEHAHGELGTSIFKRVLGTWEVYAVSGTILKKLSHITGNV